VLFPILIQVPLGTISSASPGFPKTVYPPYEGGVPYYATQSFSSGI